MLSEEQLEIISEAITPLFQYLEKEVIADIARRIAKTLTYSRTAELQAMSMAKLGYSPAKIRKEAMKLINADKEYRKAVAKNTLEYKRDIRDIINNIVKEAYKANDEIVANAGNMSWVNDLSVWKSAGKELEDNSFLQQLVDSFSAQTAGELKNMTQTTGFKVMSGYESIESAYRRELDKAVIKICSGTFSQDKVLRDVVHDLAQSGLRSIDFASGYSMQLDTAARLAIRTGCHQLAGKVLDENIKQTGENLVYVSKHWGARNTGIGHANHEQWQGRVYFIKEGEDYRKEAKRIGQDYITDLWRATGYSADWAHENDPLGLYGYNCRHNHYAWFEGVSSLPKEQPQPEPVTINGKTYDYYAMTQKMRSMERNVRALKREKEALASLGMDTTEINAKIKTKTAEYREFCNACGVPEKTSRLRYECGTSDLKKTKAWEKYRSIEESEKADSYRIGNNVVDMKYIDSDDYKRKFDSFSNDTNLNNQIYEVAKKILKHRTGTDYEDMYLIHNTKGTIEGCQTNSEDILRVHYNESLMNAISNNEEKTLIAIHNHPTNILPDGADYVSLGYRRYRQGVIVTHDGKVYTYNIGNKVFTSGVLDRRIYKYSNVPYKMSMEDAHVKALETMREDYGTEWRELI